ncbi:molybdenum cofactor cytidylyltransferase [Luteimonas cucumeris]|uniref:Molybdenum cofactor cytidylyltransferase n=1 Tax=Luteimonas cucumeris TaxID=985012 RepID=A0A562L1W9_9GAMM|nr:nucleotidyltransferase family protein [Luteimonas cucumeris]TWI01660.1 molybdenum cofactor cytidylyltransferase [Luteimonas cucumeris]
MTDPHIALVLAAGGSTRLGRPKQLLTRDGETLVHRTARLASETGASRVLVVVGAAREAIEAELRDMTCELIVNPDWQQGLASSLRAAAPRVLASRLKVLIAGCDQPALEAAHLRALLEGASAMSSRCAATHYDDALGVPAVIPWDWFERMELQGDRGFGTRLRELQAGSLFVLESPALALDIDTQDDIDAAIATGWLDPANGSTIHRKD